jgi:hypothetical protein
MDSEMLLCGACDPFSEVPAPVLMRELCLPAEIVCKRAVALLEKNNV